MSKKKPKDWVSVLIKKGRQRHGEERTYFDGRKCYIAFRKKKDLYRSGERTMSDAVRKNIHCWALDYDRLLTLRSKQIRLVVIWVQDTGELFGTQLEHFFDKEKIQRHNYAERGGALQHYLPFEYWKRKPGKTTKL
jgi:hypothetical protein